MSRSGPPPVLPPPLWAVCCAWLVPLVIAPSAVWRASLVVTDPSGFSAAVAGGGWYLLLLSVVSLGLGFLTVGLVRPWGVVCPRWVPVAGGRVVPARAVTWVAVGGGVVLILLTAWFFVFAAFRPFEIPVAVATGGPPHARPAWSILRWYVPLVAWGPLVIAVATNHHRRRTRTVAPEPTGTRRSGTPSLTPPGE